MLPYTGDYIEHIEPGQNSLKFYSFTPRPLMRGDMYQMDDELAALLIDAHRNIGFLEGLIKYAPNKEAFAELMLLKECTYSRMIDYDSPDFKEVLTSRGTGKGNITPIVNLEAAYRAATNMEINTPDMSRICGVALNGESENNLIDVREHQTFWLGAKTNLKGYNPTAPDAVLPALADISAYLYNDHNADPLIKAALVHYQFEMIHPFEQYNGIVGRILVPMILRDVVGEVRSLICLSEYLYQNKNEYFDLLRSTQYSGGYIRWIKFFVCALGEAAKQSARLLAQYEKDILWAEQRIKEDTLSSKSIWSVYNYLKRYPVSSISHATEQTRFSFNSISKAMQILKETGIVQESTEVKNRIWEYTKVVRFLLNQPSSEE
jgi:Fic family protein